MRLRKRYTMNSMQSDEGLPPLGNATLRGAVTTPQKGKEMKYNKKSPFEKSPNECPRTCADCHFFTQDINAEYGGTCTANGCRSHTYNFSEPTNRPLPMPLNCFWWYINNVWGEVSESKAEGYHEVRLHRMTVWRLLDVFDRQERNDFIAHVHRPGGGDLIDFAIYPQAKPIYDEIKRKDQEGK